MDAPLIDRPSLRANIDDHRRVESADGGLAYPLEAIPAFGETVAVGEGLLWTRMPLPFSLDHINLYLLADGDGYAIIDTGLNTSLVRDHWVALLKSLGSPSITKIIVTHYHPDHFGLAGWLSRETGAPLYMSHGEFYFGRSLHLDARDETPEEVITFYQRCGYPAEILELMRERGYGNYRRIVSEPPMSFTRLRDGQNASIGGHNWRVVVGRGHSPEHACLFSDEMRLLFSGDQVLPRITSNISVYPSEPLADPLADWLTSINKLGHLPEDTLVLPAHNEPFLGLPRRLQELRASHQRRIEMIMGELDSPKTVLETLPALFKRRLKGMDFVLATGEALAHLHYLEFRGFVGRTFDNETVRFSAIKDFDPSVMEEDENASL